MSTYQPPERSDDTTGNPSETARSETGDASDRRGPLSIDAPSLIDEADLEDPAAYRLVSVDDLDYLHDALRDAADLLGVTAKGLRQLGVSPEEASGSCAALERHLRDINTVVFAAGTGFRFQQGASS